MWTLNDLRSLYPYPPYGGVLYVPSVGTTTYEESWEWVELTDDEWFMLADSRYEISDRIGADE